MVFNRFSSACCQKSCLLFLTYREAFQALNLIYRRLLCFGAEVGMAGLKAGEEITDLRLRAV